MLLTNPLILLPQGKAVLRIGQHELRGSLVKLEKPLAVLKKVPGASNPEMPQISDSSSKMDVDAAPSTSYEVVGVVRSKYLFKDRPKVLLDA